MSGTIEQTLLTYQEAATRVGRKVREINRWRAAGMPMTSGIRDGQRVRLVDEQVLLAWFRDRLNADPVHQARMHRIAVEEAREYGLPEPVRPKPTYRQIVPVAPQPESSRDDEDDTAQSERSVDWDSIGTLRRGAQEWLALSRALLKVDPACHRDPNYIADRVDPQRAHRMAQTCSACPVLDLCRAFAEASRPTSGFWAGESLARSAESPRKSHDSPYRHCMSLA